MRPQGPQTQKRLEEPKQMLEIEEGGSCRLSPREGLFLFFQVLLCFKNKARVSLLF